MTKARVGLADTNTVRLMKLDNFNLILLAIIRK